MNRNTAFAAASPRHALAKTLLSAGMAFACATAFAAFALPASAHAAEHATAASDAAEVQTAELEAADSALLEVTSTAPSTENLVTEATLEGFVANGTCGANVAWYLDTDGTLTLAGTGVTYSFNQDESPFYHYADQITTVKVGEGITSLGAYLFADCTALESCTLPNTLEKISLGAFLGCTSLTAIDIPNSVTTMQTYAFRFCESLESVTLSTSLQEVSSFVFSYCSALSSISLPASITKLAQGAFCGCASLADVTLADGCVLESLGNRVFYECVSLESISLPQGLINIDYRAFDGCSALAELTLPASLKSIGNEAFSGCSTLTHLSIPEATTSIDLYAFSGCPSLEAIDVAPENTKYSSLAGVLFNKNQSTLICCPGGYIGTNGIYEVPETVTSIEAYAFDECALLSEIKLPTSLRSIETSAFNCCTALKEIVIPEGVVVVKDLFYKCYSLEKVSIPASALYVDSQSFDSCFALEEFAVAAENPCYTAVDGVLFSADMKTIVSFPQNKDCTEYVIPESVTNIADYAFCGASRLERISIPAGVTSIGANAFSYCSSLAELTLPQGITAIANRTFLGCSSLTSLDIPQSVQSIGTDAFYECASLERISLPTSLSGGLGDEVFGYCYSLTEVQVPNGVQEIGVYTFAYCESLQTVTLPEGLTSIGAQAFLGCVALESLELPSTVSTLGEEAFKNCRSLISITIPGNILNIPEQAFAGCESLESLVLPEGLLSVGNWAFEYCAALRYVVLPSTLTELGEGAFAECTGVLKLSVACNSFEGIDGPLAAVDAVDGVVFADDEKVRNAAFEADLCVADLALAETGVPLEDCEIVLGARDTTLESVCYCGHVLTEGVSYTAEPAEGSVLLTGCGAFGGGAQVALEQILERLAGDEAAGTAAAISAAGFGASEWVVVARDDDFADAMSATGLAGALDAPIVLTNCDTLSAEARAEIERLGASKCYLIGGEGAISSTVAGELVGMGLSVERVWGNEACDTSVACAAALFAHGGNAAIAVVATGNSFQDALSISSFAYKYAVPIYLTGPDGMLPQAAQDALAAASGTIYVPGGPGAVAEAAVEDLFGTERVVRLYGTDGYDTSNQVASYMVEKGLLSAEVVCIACGAATANGTDALAGAALVGRSGGVLLLCNGNTALGAERLCTLTGTDSKAAPAFLTAHAGELKRAFALGGTYVLPTATYNLVADTLGVAHEE